LSPDPLGVPCWLGWYTFALDAPPPKAPALPAVLASSIHHFSWFSRRMAVLRRVWSSSIGLTLSEEYSRTGFHFSRSESALSLSIK